ncbi:DUF1254 domain-containing protein [bacterium]|nr:DUF1254 domain-containing protein [bacterium]
MSRFKRYLVIGAVIVALVAVSIQQGLQIVREGAQAYLFGYSLVLMDSTRQVMTDPLSGRAPINHFAHIQSFPDHNFRQVIRPNCDTLYSTAWIDLSPEPLILSVPDTAGRYYVMPFMDAWTNVFATIGNRTTGTGPGHYLVAGPEWRGSIPDDVKVVRSPTNMTWLIGRIQANGVNDFPNVYRLQKGFTLTPLSRWNQRAANPGIMKIDDPSAIKKTKDPSAIVERMEAGEFFAILSRLMKEQPPANADAPVLKTLAKFGIEAGKPYQINELGIARRALLKKSMEIARGKLKEIADSDRSSENNWAVIRDGIGVYGTNYNVRSFVSYFGLGALMPAEAAYPSSEKDREGLLLSGKHRYRLHFEAGKTPPVGAFWSLTMYDKRGFLIDNPIRRYAIGDRDPLRFNEDGSLDILIQHNRPTQGESNWLPAPAEPFAVTLRLYLPKEEFLNGSWKLPPIERIN